MTDRRKLVMATNNAAKLREARAIAGDRIEILSLDDIGFHSDIDETADTLEGNALIKVRAVKDATGLDCFADDTGLLVDALGGAPGVHTARYAGDECDPDRNIDLLLRNLEGATDRRAHFATCVALSLDGEEHTFEGIVQGSIASKRSGSHGFGYDPVFIPEETGVCFAEMTDDAKNAISHRGRAISAMMKWLGAICICLFCALSSNAADADWRLFNTFDDQVENIFDTPDKTYFLAHAQLYDPLNNDNADKFFFLFAKDKETGEIRHYNIQNFLSSSLIRQANYNARKNYLLLVYDDYTIDLLHDDGKVYSIQALKNFTTSSTKEVRSINFDADMNRAYLATDFGYLIIDDKKNEVSASGIYNQPIDKITRVGDHLVILRNQRLYKDDINAPHLSLEDFKEVFWAGNGEAGELLTLTSTRCLISRNTDGQNLYHILSFETDSENPRIITLSNYDNSHITENREGLLIARYGYVHQLARNADYPDYLKLRDEDFSIACGSWDFKDFHFSKPREGFYSVRHDLNGEWVVTSQPTRPNSPAVFRSTNLLYTSDHGMLVNTHGINQDFTSRNALNPILLSSFRNQEWTMYGLPYLVDDKASQLRLVNPCGLAQDPDNPDIFYFGSVKNGLLRYNIKDPSSLLHMTKSNDSPQLSGHVSVQEPYATWSGVFSVTSPAFDSRGNFVAVNLNTTTQNAYYPEIWIWTPEDRRASSSPEEFQPFTRLKVDIIVRTLSQFLLPLKSHGNENLLVYFPIRDYEMPMVIYDHNGTPKVSSDDRQVTFEGYEDSDGKFEVKYFYCAVEDPATGLVWVGYDNGVFTFDPKEIFSNPQKVSRIKVSRNDGTSLADYLLAGTAVNDISIDGQGRKWFSLAGGGLVCTSADGRTILQEISSDDSLLPSDLVYASCYNPDNNSMMIATSAGLCEYYLSGKTNEELSSSVRAYPNPVRHDYYGWVTIDGLEDDCIVKIADSAGNIVRELGPAVTGKVQWDVCGFDLNRVPSGVYFVLVSSGHAGGSYSEATKILVINR